MFFPRWIIMFCLMGTLAWGCAPVKVPVDRPPEAVWNEFQRGMPGFSPEQSFLISASITFITPDQRNRIQASIWGFMGCPIRMDLSAGLGQTIAMWYEDDQLWEAYFPGENMKYVHHDGSMGASMLGYPTPLDLRQTTMVLLGDFSGLVPENYHEVQSVNGKWKYFFHNHEVKNIVLARDGTVSSITGQGWEVELSSRRDEGRFHYYSRIDMQLSEDERALIRIRSIRLDEHKWDEDQLELQIPPEAGIMYLPYFELQQ
jgi:hypothetical protein